MIDLREKLLTQSLEEKIEILREIGILDQNNNLIEHKEEPGFISRACSEVYLNKTDETRKLGNK